MLTSSREVDTGKCSDLLRFQSRPLAELGQQNHSLLCFRPVSYLLDQVVSQRDMLLFYCLCNSSASNWFMADLASWCLCLTHMNLRDSVSFTGNNRKSHSLERDLCLSLQTHKVLLLSFIIYVTLASRSRSSGPVSHSTRCCANTEIHVLKIFIAITVDKVQLIQGSLKLQL